MPRKLTFQNARVIIIGVGGVGCWCAEALVRAGVQHITLVDNDHLTISNIRRHLVAFRDTLSVPKVEQMKCHLEAVSNQVCVTTCIDRYTADTADKYHLADYDYVIDCIDSIEDKVLLILNATSAGVKFYSSMGAAFKTDPTQVQTAEFWKIHGCPLARALRQRFKTIKRFPKHKFTAVYSAELKSDHEATACTTGTFGFTLASLVINDINNKSNN